MPQQTKFKKKKSSLFRIIIGIFLFSFVSISPAIAKGNIGDKCTDTAEIFDNACTIGECEESSLGPAYCVCNNDSDCAKIYGGSEYEWECRNGDTTSFGLNYCLNEKTSEPKFPIGGNKEASLLDHALNPEAAIGANEIMDLIKKPQPKITVPGLSFTDPANIQTVEEEGNKYIIIPYLGEFISLAYIYIIAAIGIAATVMIIDGGLIYIMSKGDSEKIKHSTQKISRSVIALLLAVFSYTLLNGLNPELVRLRSLKILTVPRLEIPLPEEDDSVNYAGFQQIGAAGCNVTPPTWTAKTFDCSQKDSYPGLGVVPETCIVSYTCDGIEGTIRTIPEMQGPLCKVGILAKQAGYTLKAQTLTSSYRPFKKQADNWCGEGAKKYPNVEARDNFYAVPGFSNHGHGRAVDMVLLKNGKQLFATNSTTQCDASVLDIETIANFFYTADSKFNRLETEIWHFEYGTEGQSPRGKFTGKPSKCK